MTLKPLDAAMVRQSLAQLPGWTHEGDKLQRVYTFRSFREAMSFVVRISYEAESMNHHPEIFNVYNTVKISLATHDAGNRVTQKDLDLAGSIQRINWT